MELDIGDIVVFEIGAVKSFGVLISKSQRSFKIRVVNEYMMGITFHIEKSLVKKVKSRDFGSNVSPARIAKLRILCEKVKNEYLR